MNRRLIHHVILVCLLAAGRMAAGEETNSVPGYDLPSFRIITERNIFDPNRSGRTRNPKSKKKSRIDSFSLVGTMSYEKGRYAFFTGSSPEYQKTLKAADTIAGYKIAEIAPDFIKLAASSNQFINLAMGAQMKRRDGGPWGLATRPDAEAEATPSTEAAADGSTTESAPTKGETAIEKKMRLRREAELKDTTK
jgi:hypothetical protein